MTSSTHPTTWALLKRFWFSYLCRYWGGLLVSLLCMGGSALATASLAHALQPLFDDIFTNRQGAQLWPLAGMILGIFLLKGFSGYGQIIFLTGIGQKVTAHIQKNVFNHLMDSDVSLFQNRASGGLLSVLTYDTQIVRTGMTNTVLTLGRDVLTVVFLIGVMFYKDSFLATLSFVAFPIAIWPMRTFGQRMRRFSSGAQGAMEHLSIFFQQAFQGVRLIKAYGMEAHEKQEAASRIDGFLKLTLKGIRLKAGLHPLMEMLGGVATVSVVLYGGYHVIEGSRTTGAFISFIAALLLAYEPMKKLVHLSTELQEGLSALNRLFQVLDIQPTVVNRKDARPLHLTDGLVCAHHVTFSYPGSPVAALDNVSLTIPGGAKVAFVGPSGAGKSTLFNLLLRFYDFQEGSLTIDGQDIAHGTLASLREQFAFVGQEIHLFNETIADNIRYGSPQASFEQIQEAARNASAADFIEALPLGYETLIGENGLKLSGGQRQRLAIARAMLKNAPILLLDEATAALDTQSEWQVQKALERLMCGRTTLTIAHRLSTVEKADIIFVLSHGRLVEQGDHASLMAQGGLYARLVFPQLKEERSGVDRGEGWEN